MVANAGVIEAQLILNTSQFQKSLQSATAMAQTAGNNASKGFTQMQKQMDSAAKSTGKAATGMGELNKAISNASSKFTGFNSQLTKAIGGTNGFIQTNKQLATAINTASSSTASLGNSLGTLPAKTSSASGAFGTMASAVRGVGSAFVSAIDSMVSFNVWMAAIVGYAFGKFTIGAAMQVDSAKNIFKFVGMSADEVQRLTGSIKDYSEQAAMVSQPEMMDAWKTVRISHKMGADQMTKYNGVMGDTIALYKASGRTAHDAALAIEDGLGGSVRRLTMELGITKKELMDMGWSGLESDVDGFFNALDRIYQGRQIKGIAKDTGSLLAKWENLKEKLQNIGVMIGQAVMPALEMLVNAFSWITENVPRGITATVVALGGMLVILGLMWPVINNIRNAFKEIALFQAIGNKIPSLPATGVAGLGPVALTATAVTLMVAAGATLNYLDQTGQNNSAYQTGRTTGVVTNPLTGITGGVSQGVVGFWQDIFAGKNPIEAFGKAVETAFSGGLNRVWGDFSPLKWGWDKIWTPLVDKVSSTWDTLTDIFGPVKDAFADVASELGPALGDLGGAFGELWGAIGEVVDAFMSIFEPVTAVSSGMQDLSEPVADNKSTLETLRDAAKWLAERIREARPYVQEFARWIKNAADKIREFAQWVRDTAQAIRSFGDKIRNFDLVAYIKSKLGITGNFSLSGLYNSARDWVWQKISNITGSFSLTRLYEFAKNVVSSKIGLGGGTIRIGGFSVPFTRFGPAPRGPPSQSFLSKASGFRYESYGGMGQTIGTTLSRMSGNCVDGSLAQIALAESFGIPSELVATTWKGNPHVFARIAGRDRDIANHALTGSWSAPPRGPGGSGMTVIINGDLYGFSDFKRQVSKAVGEDVRWL